MLSKVEAKAKGFLCCVVASGSDSSGTTYWENCCKTKKNVRVKKIKSTVALVYAIRRLLAKLLLEKVPLKK